MKVDVRDGDAIAGVRPRAAFAPGSVDECAEVMTMAAREQLRVGFVGGGTELGLGAAPAGLDAVVRTERLAKIVEYAPADMVIVVEAGVTLAALQAETRAHGQRLALDAPRAERATIGGLVATGGFGPLRARYGGIRDLIIGVTLVRADGGVARGGGKVVKNVAGFDLPKVACGSLGTLGLVAAAAFRLHPLPETTVTVLVPGLAVEGIVALVAAARQAQLEPAAVVALTAAFATAAGSTSDVRGFDLGVRFEGFERGVQRRSLVSSSWQGPRAWLQSRCPRCLPRSSGAATTRSALRRCDFTWPACRRGFLRWLRRSPSSRSAPDASSWRGTRRWGSALSADLRPGTRSTSRRLSRRSAARGRRSSPRAARSSSTRRLPSSMARSTRGDLRHRRSPSCSGSSNASIPSAGSIPAGS